MPHYRITRRGAKHSRREGEKRAFRDYGYGDTIQLTEEQYTSGRYSNLGLAPVSGSVDVTKHGGAFKAQDVVDQAPAAPVGDDEDGEGKGPDQNDVELQKQKDADAGNQDADETTQTELSDEDRKTLESLKKDVEAVDSGPTLTAARKKVIESGLLGEESTVPTKKKDLLEAVEAKLGTQE